MFLFASLREKESKGNEIHIGIEQLMSHLEFKAKLLKSSHDDLASKNKGS